MVPGVCSYVQSYEPENPATHGGRNLERMTMQQLYEAFGLQETTIDFVVRAARLREMRVCRRNIRLSGADASCYSRHPASRLQFVTA